MSGKQVLVVGAVVVVLGIIGAQGQSGSSPSQPPAAAPAAGTGSIPIATPAAKTLLDLQGSGISRSAKFTTSGDWAIAWSYDCSSFGSSGNFQVYVQGDQMDVAANALGPNGSGTQPEYTGPGTFYLEMNSECSWHVTVTG